MEKTKADALAREFEQGSKEAFGELYDAYLKPVYNFIYFKTHHRETAEELTSEVFLKAYKSSASFSSSKGTFQAWVYKIARNIVIDHYRAHKTNINIEDVWDLSGNENIAKDVENKILLEKVESYLKELPSEHRDIIIMRVWQELSYSEIAEIVGKSEASCKMSFSRSLQKLRTIMPEALFIFILALVLKK